MAWLMVRAAMSQRVSAHLYRQESWFRTRFHLKPKDPAIYRRGLKLGFGFASLWGVAAVCVGVAIITTNVF